MLTADVTFNGKHCSELNLEVTNTKRPLFAETKDQFVDIPFLDGSFLLPDKSKRDINVEVSFLLNPVQGKSFYDRCRDIAAWLSTDNWSRLIFDDDPNYYYQAKVVSEIGVEQIVQFGEFTVVFRCKPIMQAVGT